MSIQLRDYQQEDVGAVLASFKSHRRVLGRAATGLGKAVELAALVQEGMKSGRVMVLVDTRKLVRQLADTIKWYTGVIPGVHMGEERSANGNHFMGADPVVVGTVQTMYSGPDGKEEYRSFDPSQFSMLLLDECELFLAPKSKAVVDYFVAGNSNLRVFGCTATPIRTDGVAMAELFDTVAFDRDILWGINNGWLVPAKQAFVRVSIDFSTLKVRKDDEGEQDYSDAEIAERLNTEQNLIELAKGIIHVAQDRKSIVVCPDVATAKGVTHYLDGEKRGCARVVYGEMTDIAKDDVMDGHRRGEFQFLVSVMMLTKGYDDPSIEAVFNCRKTKSKRLYTQIMGRGVRPLKGLLDGIEDIAARRAAIASSAKPEALMVNLVGIDGSVRDVTILDILGTARSQEVIDRAKEIADAEGISAEDALDRAEEEVEQRQEEAQRIAEAAAEEADAIDEAEDWERKARSRVQVQAHIDVEYSNDLAADGGDATSGGGIEPRHMSILQKAKVPPKDIAKLTPEQAASLSREIVKRWKTGMCSYMQGKMLIRVGYSKDEVKGMTRDAASAALDAAKQNNWKRAEVLS